MKHSPYAQMFDFDSPIARTSDPIDSHEAAEKVNRSENCIRFAQAVKALGSATAKEVERYWQERGCKDAETVRKRQSEVVEAGLVKIVGRRRCGVTGSVVRVYGLVTHEN